MKSIILTAALVLASTAALAATPDFLTCSTPQGPVELTFYPLSVSFKTTDGSDAPVLRYGNICAHDVSDMNPQPSCRVVDKSEDHYLIQTLECQNDGKWFAEAFVEISYITKEGRFTCKGLNQKVDLELSNCRR
ncbi:hypothetical protein [Bdellovibrio sp. HCB209]|uniref:hypothetical protein n=1 Tax=Bdellovibrio sp. HCB209 TaxID=3394354 RepID=UPI0039B406E3